MIIENSCYMIDWLDMLLYGLRQIAYPMMAFASFLSFAMRIYTVWYIHKAEDSTPMFWWKRLEARKLMDLAITNLFMLLAFGTLALTAGSHPVMTQTGKLVVIWWSCCWPFYMYSAYIKYTELLERIRQNHRTEETKQDGI